LDPPKQFDCMCNRANFLPLLPSSQDIETMPEVLNNITAAAEYNHWVKIRAWICCLGHNQRGSSQLQKKMVLVAHDLVGLCSGEDHPRVDTSSGRQHTDKLVLAP
jgi:hypothetical protein